MCYVGIISVIISCVQLVPTDLVIDICGDKNTLYSERHGEARPGYTLCICTYGVHLALLSICCTKHCYRSAGVGSILAPQ